MEKWREVWRNGFAKAFSLFQIQTLRDALDADSDELIQKSTVEPEPTSFYKDKPIVCACAVTFCGWKGEVLATAEEGLAYFRRLRREIDYKFPQYDRASLHFIYWFDSTERNEMREAFIAELDHNIKEITNGK